MLSEKKNFQPIACLFVVGFFFCIFFLIFYFIYLFFFLGGGVAIKVPIKRVCDSDVFFSLYRGIVRVYEGMGI